MSDTKNDVGFFRAGDNTVHIYTQQRRGTSRHTIVPLTRDEARELRNLLNVQLEGSA